MKMLSALFLAVLTVASVQNSQADTVINPALEANLAQSLTSVAPYDLINWKVGDEANYDVKVGMFGKLGTLVKSVTKEEGGAVWVKQEAKLAIQNDTTEMLMNRADGKILKVIHNGKEENAPDDKPEIISQDTTEVTVPAGTFKCIHVVGKSQKVEKFELWANPRDTVMDGAIKMLISGNMEMTMELTSFKKN